MHKCWGWFLPFIFILVLSGCNGENIPLDFSANERHVFWTKSYTYLRPDGWKIYDALEMESSKFEFIEKLKKNRFERVTGLNPTEIQMAVMRNGYKNKDSICPHLLPNIAFRELFFLPMFKYHTFSKEDAEAAVQEQFMAGTPECTVSEQKLNGRDVIYASCNRLAVSNEKVRITKEVVWVRTLPKFDEVYCKDSRERGDKCLPFFQIACIFNTKASEKSQASCLDFVKHMEFKE